MLRQRLVTGPILIALLVGILWLDGRLDGWAAAQGLPRGPILLSLGVVLSVAIALETAGFLLRAGLRTSAWSCVAAALGGLAATAGAAIAPDAGLAAGIAATGVTAMLLAGLAPLARSHDPRGSLALAGGTALAGVYGGVLLGFWLLVRLEHAPWVVAGAVLVVKSCDIGAYFTGLAIGRHRMIPWLSPKKTWEGLAGGVVTATAVGAGFATLSAAAADAADRVPLWAGALGGALVALIGQLGDLSESAFKRDATMKDSGRILPGMGGVLDVLDSPLFAGPVVYWLLRASTGG